MLTLKLILRLKFTLLWPRDYQNQIKIEQFYLDFVSSFQFLQVFILGLWVGWANMTSFDIFYLLITAMLKTFLRLHPTMNVTQDWFAGLLKIPG